MTKLIDFDDLYDHQKRAIEWAKDKEHAAFFMDAGVGKTAVAINLIRHHSKEQRRLVPTLILCPIVILNQWKEEFSRFSKIPQSKIFVCYGNGKKRAKQIETAIAETKGDCVIITNYETLSIDDCFLPLYHWEKEIIVLDEAHRCKTHDSKRSKRTTMLADKTKRKYLLTGTPITNSPIDIFQQYRILDKGETFGDNFFVFRHVWFEDANAQWRHNVGHFPKYVIKQDKISQMNELINRKAIRAKKSECMDLPPFVRVRVNVEMSKEQKRLYEEMKKHFIAFIKSEMTGNPSAIIANQAAVKALRLQQIVTGYCKLEDGSVQIISDNPREAALKELLSDLTIQSKVIVWCSFIVNYKQVSNVCEELGLECAYLTGETTDREGNIKAFRENPDIKVLVANPQAASLGINLIEAPYSIYFSKGFNLEHDIQSEARNYRGGSEIHEKITRYDIVAPGTIDEIIMDALEKKQNVADRIIELYEKLDEPITL